MSSEATRKVYIVQRLDWEYNDYYFDLKNDEPVKAFTYRDYAEFYRDELEKEANWRYWNPCDFMKGLERATSLSEDELLSRLRELGVPEPPMSEDGLVRDWLDYEWWEDAIERMRQWDPALLWKLFDKVRFYEVVEVELPVQI